MINEPELAGRRLFAVRFAIGLVQGLALFRLFHVEDGIVVLTADAPWRVLEAAGMRFHVVLAAAEACR